MPRGRLVTVEGIDGSGKSTLARALADALAAAGLPVERTAEPTRTWLGEAVRRALQGDEPPVVDALLFLADHAAHVPRVRATLDAGVHVVSDRWSDSTLAYQGAALDGAFPDPVRWLRDAGRPFELRPDVTLLLDLPVEDAVARLKARGAPAEKFEDARFLSKVRDGYLALARDEPRRFVIVDARPGADEILARAQDAVLRRIGTS